MWKMIAAPKRDNMFDFPGIPFVVALSQHLEQWTAAIIWAFVLLGDPFDGHIWGEFMSANRFDNS